MEQTHEDVAKADVTPEEVKTDAVSTVTHDQKNLPKGKQNRRMLVAVLLGILLVLGAFLFTRGFIVAATVNGSPVSRLSVIQELEKTAGKATLETIINKKLVESELSRLNLKADVEDVSKRISELEAQISAQGGTLGEVLISEGMTMELLGKQIETTLRLEQVLAPKTLVTDEEVEAFIKTGDSPLPTGAEGDAIKLKVKNQLQQQKFQTEAQQWVADVTKEAKIKYYVSY